MGTAEGAIDLVELAYAPADSHEAWAKRIVGASAKVFGRRDLLGMTCIRHTADATSVDPLFWAGVDRTIGEEQGAMLAEWGLDSVRAIYYPPHYVTTHSELEAALHPSVRVLLAASRQAFGITECLGMLVHPEPGVAASFFASFDRTFTPSRHQRARLTQIALHLEAGLRLRLRPDAVRAVLDPSGKLLHREDDAPDSPLLTARVRGIEKARIRAGRSHEDALDLWPALLGGRVSLVERIEGSQRFYCVLENAPATQRFRALTRAEIDVLSHAARSLSSKQIGYALGLSVPTVSNRLASAAAKIGVSTRLELVRLAAMLTHDPRAGFEQIALTTAERDVLALLRQGLSNADIARFRNRSVRTIANQVAQLLRKTGSPTRRALVSRLPR